MNSTTGLAPLYLSLWFFTAIKNNTELNSLMRAQRQLSTHDHQEFLFFLDRVAFFSKEFTWEENKFISLDLHSGTAQNEANQWIFFPSLNFTTLNRSRWLEKVYIRKRKGEFKEWNMIEKCATCQRVKEKMLYLPLPKIQHPMLLPEPHTLSLLWFKRKKSVSCHTMST